jgi:hypothetical protein
MIAAVPNVIGWLAISFAKVRFNYHLFSFHAPASLFLCFLQRGDSVVVHLFTSELVYPGFILFVYGPVAGRIWSWCNILHSMPLFSPPS